MKTIAIYIIAISLLSCKSHLAEKKSPIVGHIPAFKLISGDSTRFLNSADLPSGHPTLLMYFSPSCDHCQRQVKSILSHLQQISDVQIYLVTDDSFKEIKAFSEELRLDTAENIMVTKDLSYSFFAAYKPTDVPYIAIYDAKKQLKKIYSGETEIDFIINTVRE